MEFHRAFLWSTLSLLKARQLIVKIEIVACGKIADAHVEEIRRNPLVNLVAVCDLEPIVAEPLAKRYAIPRSAGNTWSQLPMECWSTSSFFGSRI
jgi:hypothetical protein